MQNLFAFLNNVYLESENKGKQPWTMNNDASINQAMIFITQTYCDQKLKRKSAKIQKKPNTVVLCPALLPLLIVDQGRHLNIWWLQFHWLWKKLHDSNTDVMKRLRIQK